MSLLDNVIWRRVYLNDVLVVDQPQAMNYVGAGLAVSTVDGRTEINLNSLGGEAFTPAPLAADADNYAPAGAETAGILRLSTNGGNFDLTGLVSTDTPPRRVLLNVGAAGDITLKHDGAGSTAVNRFATPGAMDVVLGPGAAAIVDYDLTSLRYRVIAIAVETIGGTDPLKLNRSGTPGLTGPLEMGFNRLAEQFFYAVNVSIAAQQNDYNPAGWSTLDILGITATGAPQNITGFLATGLDSSPARKVVFNDGTFAITLKHLTTSAAANQIACPGSVDLTLEAQTGAVLSYHSLTSKWVVLASSAAATAGSAKLNRSGSPGMTGALDMGGFGLLSLGYATITPAALGADQNNYLPAGFAGADVVRLATTGGTYTVTGFDVTGLTASRKVIRNADPTNTIVIAHEAAGSLAANRIAGPGTAGIILRPNQAVTLQYDSTLTRWLVIENTAPLTKAILSPPAIVATTSDYAPTGGGQAETLALTVTGDQGITGMIAPGPNDRTFKRIVNIDTTDTVTLSHENVASAAANRFVCPDSLSVVLRPNDSVFVEYAGSRWYVIGDPGRYLNLRDPPLLKPPQILANQNDYDPTGFGRTQILALDLDANRTITGFQAPTFTDLEMFALNNTSAFTLTLAHESASSAAANRIITPGNANYNVAKGAGVWLFYDTASTRWRVIGA